MKQTRLRNPQTSKVETTALRSWPKGPLDVQITISSAGLTETVFEGRLFPRGQRTSKRVPLTPRECEIVQLLADGRSNKEVAAMLTITVKTAETHRTNIMRKLAIRSMSELVRYAIRNNLIKA